MRRVSVSSASSVLIVLSIFSLVLTLEIWAYFEASPQFRTYWNQSPTELRAAFGAGDAGSYLQGGIALASGAVFAPELLSDGDVWILTAWPPGMFLVYASIVWLGLPVALTMAALTVSIWAAVGTVVVLPLLRRSQWLFAGAFAFVWLGSPLTVMWVTGLGLFYAEGFGIALLCAALAFAYQADRRIRSGGRREVVGWAGLAGFSLGFAVYFRFPLFAVLLFVVAMGIAWMVAAHLWDRRPSEGPNSVAASGSENCGLNLVLSRRTRTLGLASLCLCAVVSLLPWYGATVVIGHPVTIERNPATIGSFMWNHRWMTDRQLEEAGAQFVEVGGGNWACDIAPRECVEIQSEVWNGREDFLRNSAVKAAFRYPVDFIKVRVGTFSQGWISAPHGMQSVSAFTVLFGLMSMLTVLCCLVVGFRLRRRALLLNLLGFSTFLGSAAVLITSHIEPRYFAPVMAVSWAWLALLLSLSPRRVVPVSNRESTN